MMRRPFLSSIALPALSWALPFHIVLMAFLFGGLGLSEGLVRGAAAWKEMAVIALVAIAAARAIWSRKPKMEIAVPDLCVLALFVTAVSYLVAENLLLGAHVPTKAALYGIRDTTFFMLLYFVGRATPEIGESTTALRTLFLVALATSVIAVFELLFVTPEMLVYLGAASYFQDFLGVTAFTVGNDYGLPTSYWSRLGNTDVRRAGSVYLSGQGFAIPFLLFLPVATVWVFGRDKRPGWLALLGYVLLWVGLLLTLTRMTIIACVIQLFFYLLWRRKLTSVVAGGIIGAAAMVVLIFVIPSFLSFAWQTLTWQTGSSTTHLSDWTRGVIAFGSRPWGWGLGTTDATAVRAGLEPLTADNQYLKYAVELGVVGLLTHLAVLLTLMAAGFQLARLSSRSSRRLLGQTLVLATVGIMINAMTAVVFNSMVLSYLYFWIAGSVVSLWQIERGKFRVPIGHPVIAHA